MHLLVVNLLCIWSCTCLMLCTVGRYFVLNFRIPTVFDIIPLELVRFRNSRYSVSSCSFSCLACPLSLSLSYFKCKSRKRFTYFSTVFYFSTFNLKYSEFKIRFKPNLANCTGHTAQLQAAHHAAAFFLLVASCPLL